MPSLSCPRRGFTLIELLIVMVVLGILFVIGLFLFNDVRESSYNTKAKAHARTALVKATSGYVGNGNSFGTSDAAAVAQMPDGEGLNYVSDPANLTGPSDVYVQLDDGVNDLPSAGGDLAELGQQITVCALSETGVVYCIRTNQDEALAVSSSQALGGASILVNEGGSAYSRGETPQEAVCNLPTAGFPATPGSCGGGVPSWSGEAPLAPTGVVYAMGSDSYGMRGDGSTSTSADAAPTAVQGLPATVTKVDAGSLHACALAEGDVYCWGDNGNGQVGVGSNTTAAYPSAQPVVGLPGDATDIFVDQALSCALVGGDPYCWGYTAYTFGDGTTYSSFAPLRLALPSATDGNVTKVVNTTNTNMCVLAVGKAYCWGRNSSSELGTGVAGVDILTPQEMPGTTNVTDISTPLDAICLIDSGVAKCIGSNMDSQIGDGGGTGTRSTLTNVAGISGTPVEVASILRQTCARTSAGKVYCWGTGSEAYIAAGTTATLLDGSVASRRVASIKPNVNPRFACMLATDRTLHCAGAGGHAMGTGTSTDSAQPVQFTATLPAGSIIGYTPGAATFVVVDTL